MHASAPPPPSTVDESGSLVLRFGTAVGLALIAALACALPAALRVSSSGVGAGAGGAVRAWVALSAAALAPMVGAVVVLRGAGEGLKAFGGPGAELRAFGAALWLASLLVTLAFFGSVLRATTHHHALAGVTFAAGAVALAIGTALVCVRIVAVLLGVSAGARRALVVALGSLALLAIAWVGVRFVRAAAGDPASSAAAGTVVDVLAFALGALFAARRSLATRRQVALIGPPIAVFVAAVGVSTMRDAPLLDAIDERAPAFAPVVDLARSH
jgi:hypothetical protein